MKIQKWKIGAAATAAAAAFVINGQAQSVDSLLDKLVDKGVLTVDEAKDLRSQSDQDFNTAYQAKTGLPDWVTTFKWSGDFRGRFENFNSENNDFQNRNRWRYRLRFGATISMLDDLEAGFRLGSGDIDSANNVVSGVDPLSQNQSLQNNASKKGIFVDLAYAKWSPLHNEDWLGSMTIGKMVNPYTFTDMVFDYDYTPEGAALQLTRNINDQQKLVLNNGAFVLDESGSTQDDPYMAGFQLLLNSEWSKKVSTSFGIGWMKIFNPEQLTTASVPNVNVGNSRYTSVTVDSSGKTNTNYALSDEFKTIIADASVTYTVDKAPFYNGAFPITLSGEYLDNCGASSGQDNIGWSATLQFGKASKRGTWEFDYTYKWLGANAWYEETVDSDFGAYYQAKQTSAGVGAGYGAGTNVKGHILRLAYAPYDQLLLSGKLFLTDLINPIPSGSQSGMMRIQIDAMLKF
jgi:hypothetical protein